MHRYKMTKKLGDGASGSVHKAYNKATGDIVAIKMMKNKFYTWEECVKLREVRSLKKLHHPNIVNLKEVIRENDILYFVFEYLECNIFETMKNRDKRFSETKVRNIMWQVLQGITFMHNKGFFHRDLKPENLLVTNDVVKIADFGLAREIRSRPPYTDYVATRSRWYRAPELLLRSTNYSSPVDIWALGCIMAELLTFRPLFPGSSESDQLYKIISILGTPTEEIWGEGVKSINNLGIRVPEYLPTPLESVITSCSKESIQVISDMLVYDPKKRPTADKILQYPFFQIGQGLPRVINPVSSSSRPHIHKLNEKIPLSALFAEKDKRDKDNLNQSYLSNKSSSILPDKFVIKKTIGSSNTSLNLPTQKESNINSNFSLRSLPIIKEDKNVDKHSLSHHSSYISEALSHPNEQDFSFKSEAKKKPSGVRLARYHPQSISKPSLNTTSAHSSNSFLPSSNSNIKNNISNNINPLSFSSLPKEKDLDLFGTLNSNSSLVDKSSFLSQEKEQPFLNNINPGNSNIHNLGTIPITTPKEKKINYSLPTANLSPIKSTESNSARRAYTDPLNDHLPYYPTFQKSHSSNQINKKKESRNYFAMAAKNQNSLFGFRS